MGPAQNDREMFFENVFKKFRSFCESPSKKIDFAYRPSALAHLGTRELRAVKISASCDAWRPTKQRNDTKRNERRE